MNEVEKLKEWLDKRLKFFHSDGDNHKSVDDAGQTLIAMVRAVLFQIESGAGCDGRCAQPRICGLCDQIIRDEIIKDMCALVPKEY